MVTYIVRVHVAQSSSAVAISGHSEVHSYMAAIEIMIGIANCAVSVILRWRGQFIMALLAQSQLDLAEILIRQGNARAAISFLERAEISPVTDVATRAHALLHELSPR